MTTRLGPAVIQVTLDTRAARKQLAELERLIKMRGQSGQLGPTAAAMHEKDREGEDTQKKVQELEARVERLGNGKQSASRFGVGRLVAGAAALTGTAFVVERVLAGTGEFIKEMGQDEDPISKKVNEKVGEAFQFVSDKISDLMIHIKAAFPTWEQFKDINRARFLLGQKPTVAGETELIEGLYGWNRNQEDIRRQREKILPEQIGGLFAQMLKGGLKK